VTAFVTEMHSLMRCKVKSAIASHWSGPRRNKTNKIRAIHYPRKPILH